jgi:hypothetical protein
LFSQPFGVVTRWAATCDDCETFFAQTLANGGTDATHTTCDICYFSDHAFLLFVKRFWLTVVPVIHFKPTANLAIMNAFFDQTAKENPDNA